MCQTITWSRIKELLVSTMSTSINSGVATQNTQTRSYQESNPAPARQAFIVITVGPGRQKLLQKLGLFF